MKKTLLLLAPYLNEALKIYANNYSVNCTTDTNSDQDCPQSPADALYYGFFYSEMALLGLGTVMNVIGECKRDTDWGRVVGKSGYILTGASAFGFIGTTLGLKKIFPQEISSPVGLCVGLIAGNYAYKKLHRPVVAPLPVPGAAPPGRCCGC